MHPERKTKAKRRMVNSLDYCDINFLVSKRIMVDLKKRIAPAQMCWLVMKMDCFIQCMQQIRKI